uniref:Uncharacterized protein n=1 Tax=Anguilla anguilla TaxID=7936 RepID=A0A0E9VKK7_ANGAN
MNLQTYLPFFSTEITSKC